MRRVAVFCGSNFGSSDLYREGAAALGRHLAGEDIEIVFGGTGRGIMGVLASSALEQCGTVHGVATTALLEKGHVLDCLSVLEIVDTRSVRKQRMAELADGFIAMPGGLGTLEEILEMWVDAQFAGHAKPLAIFNVNGFYDPFIQFLDKMIAEKFLPAPQREMIIIADSPAELVEEMQKHQPVTTPKWM